jgi:predicted site-specific integrase-resolvase
MSKYLSGKKTSEILKVHQRTLHNWDKKGIIETIRSPGGRRLYNVNKYIEEYEQKEEIKRNDQIKIAYIRVSTAGQKDDLKRQKEYMRKKYPKHQIIEDIGSGINFNRKGLRKIITLAIEGKIKELVVACKDRLTRFGFELIEDLIKEYSGGTIKVINKKVDEEPEIELAKDVLQILNVFTAKMNGLRKYK